MKSLWIGIEICFKNLLTSTLYCKCEWKLGCVSLSTYFPIVLLARKVKQYTLPVQIELSAITAQSTSWHVHMCVVEMLTGATISLWQGTQGSGLMRKHTVKINWANTHTAVFWYFSNLSVRPTNYDLWPEQNMSIHHNYSTHTHTHTLPELRVANWLTLMFNQSHLLKASQLKIDQSKQTSWKIYLIELKDLLDILLHISFHLCNAIKLLLVCVCATQELSFIISSGKSSQNELYNNQPPDVPLHKHTLMFIPFESLCEWKTNWVIKKSK